MKGVKAKALAGAAVLGMVAVPSTPSWAAQHMARATEASSSFVPTIPIAATPAISTLDPSNWAAQILVDQGTVMEGLYGYSPTGQVVPKIATGYKVSDKGLVWTFFLRHNARWSNGAPVTAEDFYYSWMRTASPQNTNDALWASVMEYVANAWAYHGNSVPASAVGVKVVNPYEIQLRLSAPHDILGIMVVSGSMPLYPPSVKAHPTNWFMPQYFVGDGPYVVKSFVPNGQITLARNPFYVGAPGETNVGNIQEMNLIPQSTVPVEDYVANKLSAAVITSPSDYKYVLDHPSLKAQLHSQPDNQIMYLEWDKSVQASPLDNLLVRQAIAMAIDRQPIVNDVLQGMAGATNVFGYPGWPTYSLQHPLTYNVQKARQWLAKAGYPGGKGMPTLTIYAEVTSVNPESIPVAEAVQEELKQNLGISSKIVPEPSTEYGNITWGGLNQGVAPGYIIGGGTPNWDDVTSLPIQSNQQILFHGTIGPAWYRQHDSNYYFPTYDPQDVAQLGNPNDASMGTKPSDWAPLEKAAATDIAYLKAWTAKQPAAYQAVLNVPGQESYQQEWDNYLTAWHQAKTPAALHTAWVNAWKFLGDWSAGNGGANVGLNGLVWDDQHMTHGVYLATMWNAELNGALTQQQAVPLAANIDNFMLRQAWGVPLYYLKTFYLLKPGLSGVEANPWSWGGLYQMQYLTYHG
jgi:peptide/nickel transport system substrate-binding protein/oligopeptide transport system substrate-binding protein